MSLKLDQEPRDLALDVIFAVGTSILNGICAAWLILSVALLHAPRSYGWLAAASLAATVGALALVRFSRRRASVMGVATATLLDLGLSLFGGSVAILLLACRFDAYGGL